MKRQDVNRPAVLLQDNKLSRYIIICDSADDAVDSKIQNFHDKVCKSIMTHENERLHKAILEVIRTQVRDNDPPETKQTYERLRNEGFSDRETLKLIGYVVATEVFTVLKENRRYDRQKYISALKSLPRLPWEKE